jgi:hypothetical protein
MPEDELIMMIVTPEQERQIQAAEYLMRELQRNLALGLGVPPEHLQRDPTKASAESLLHDQ